MEIERKFKVNYLPGELSSFEAVNIEQGYLNRHPVVRVRRWNNEYILTYKSKMNKDIEGEGAIENIEEEFPLTRGAYEHLLAKADNHPITKVRYIIPLEDGHKAELDVFKGRLEGLMFAEVEFTDLNDARAFKKPQWLGEDVSFDKRYRNTALSMLEKYEPRLFEGEDKYKDE